MLPARAELPERQGDVQSAPAAAIAGELVNPVRFERLGRATVPPVLGVEVLGLGDVAGERHELRAELVAKVGRCAAVSSASRSRQSSASSWSPAPPPPRSASRPSPPRRAGRGRRGFAQGPLL